MRVNLYNENQSKKFIRGHLSTKYLLPLESTPASKNGYEDRLNSGEIHGLPKILMIKATIGLTIQSMLKLPATFLIAELCFILNINNVKLLAEWGFDEIFHPGSIFLQILILCIAPNHPVSLEFRRIQKKILT